jgi:acetate kinase
MDAILVVNAGSSSLKFQVFETDGISSLKRLVKGEIEGMGGRPRLRAQGVDSTPLVDQFFDLDVVPDVAGAIREAGAWLRKTQKFNLVAVGHRVVHGGPGFSQPILIDASVLETLERCIPLAPLHEPNNLESVRFFLKSHPELPQVACFDTAFHRGHSAAADHFAIPEALYKEGVRRYGFHGLSYEFIARRLQELSPDVAKSRVIVAHLGNGASMCALKDGRSVESTMGFTALDGLPMGTRPGQIDPGVVLYLISQKGMSVEAVQKLLYYECGLKGLSGISSDMRVLEASNEPGAILAIDYFAYRIGLHAGMLAAALGGLDAFVFTAGIGENSAEIRARIVDKLGWLGAELDVKANVAHKLIISRPDSRMKVFVIKTDEELMIAEHTLAVISVARRGREAADGKGARLQNITP